MPQNSNFLLLAVIDFSHKMEVTVMAPNHGGDTIESILGPIGSHWVQKMGQNRQKLPCPKFEFSTTPRSSIFPKIGSYGYGAKSRLISPRVHLGASGVPLGKKMGQNCRKLPCPKIRIFVYPSVIGFSQKKEVTVMAPNYGGDPLGSVMGPMGSHWVKQMCQNRKKLPCPKIRIFDYPAVIDFSHKMEVTVMAPNHGGDTIHLGANGVPLGKKNGSKP